MMRIPPIVKQYYPDLIWRVETDAKELYLTFDDGPTPRVTSWVLNELKKYDAKATFFCLGKNVRSHPSIYKRILSEKHAVGNHTYDHKKGWVTSNFIYLKSVLKCRQLVQSDLFRPPYGRIKKTQIKALKEQYRIVMWDVLSEDYNIGLSPEKCASKVIEQSTPGSIIVFHDSKKAYRNLKMALPEVLRHFSATGYTFKALF